MTLTTLQKLELFRDLIDETGTGRVDDEQIIRLLNLAISDIVEERYDPIKNAQNKTMYFQAVQRVRDELRTLVKQEDPITFNANTIDYPVDYNHLLLLNVTIDGKKVNSIPITYDWLGANENNPHTSPSAKRVKHIEKADGIEVYNNGATITTGVMDYLSQPIAVNISSQEFNKNAFFVDGQLLIVSQGTVEYPVASSVFYTVGQSFTIASPNNQFDGTGLVKKVTNTNMPANIHEEIVRRAAKMQLSIMEYTTRSQMISQDEINS